MFRRVLGCCSGNGSRLALRARRFSSEPDPRFIILNPREAGIVRRHKRRVTKKPGHFHSELQPPPLVPQMPQQVSVVTEIHSRQPEVPTITLQRYTQLREELLRGFKKTQLAEYLASQGVQYPKTANKQKLVQSILNNAWHCVVRKDGEGALVENSIELSDRDFVLVLGGQGRLLREWSKSGARISLLPQRCQINVQSRQQTFNWINASLSKFLESVMATEVDISEYKKLINPLRDPELLAAIQQLTDTYFGHTNLEADTIDVYSAGHSKLSNTALVKRLLLHLTDPVVSQKWRPSAWFYDANAENHPSYFFHPFEDTDSMEWSERLKDWARWEQVKRRGGAAVPALDSIDLRELEAPSFEESSVTLDEPSSTSKQSTSDVEELSENKQAAGDDIEARLLQITKDLVAKHPAPSAPNDSVVSTTITVSPGYVLHAGGEAILPNAGMPKTFNTNIPNAAKVASGLPMYSKDVHHEGTLEVDEPKDRDLWMDILNMGPERDSGEDFSSGSKRVFTSRRKDIPSKPNLRLIQLKFVANPSQGHALEYPPIVAWATLPPLAPSSNSLLTEVPRVVAIPVEASAHVSLPGLKSDLKVSLAHSYPLKVTKDIETYFMKKCRFGRLGPLRIPPELKVEFDDGKEVSYLYHSSVYMTLAELELNKSLLQLSQVEGGKLGGRKIEASLVSHSESAEDFDMDETAATVHNAVEFVKML